METARVGNEGGRDARGQQQDSAIHQSAVAVDFLVIYDPYMSHSPAAAGLLYLLWG
jgi:hypothetical protein